MGKNVLYISGNFGLGHVARDIPIVNALRKLRPDMNLLWAAEKPASVVLREHGETVVNEDWTDSNVVMNSQSDDKDQFNLTKWLRGYNAHQKNAFKNYLSLVEKERIDVVVGDEATEVVAGYMNNPSTKKLPFIAMWDFVKIYSMTNNPMDILAAWMINRYFDRAYKSKELAVDRTIYFGDEYDVADEKLGLFLVNARQYAKKLYTFVGYPLQFDPKDYQDTSRVKEKLGYGKEPLIICSVGGTSTGIGLINLCEKAFPFMKKKIPNLRMIIVTGPSIDPAKFRPSKDLEIRGYVQDLYQHFAACDLAIVLGGGTSTLELAALNRPFLYFPLEKHSEQIITVARRNERYNAGVKLLYSKTTPDILANVAVSNIGKKVEYLDMPLDGVRKSAEIIAQFI